MADKNDLEGNVDSWIYEDHYLTVKHLSEGPAKNPLLAGWLAITYKHAVPVCQIQTSCKITGADSSAEHTTSNSLDLWWDRVELRDGETRTVNRLPVSYAFNWMNILG